MSHFPRHPGACRDPLTTAAAAAPGVARYLVLADSMSNPRLGEDHRQASSYHKGDLVAESDLAPGGDLAPATLAHLLRNGSIILHREAGPA